MSVPTIDRPLGVRPDLNLSTEQVEMMSILETADLWFVEERLVAKGLVAAERIGAAIMEFKRYFALVGLGYRGLGMQSRQVDEVWHALILFTREYADLCQKAFGSFIHHVPKTSRSKASDDAGQRFFQAYAEVFGPAPAEWMRVGQPVSAGPRSDEPSGCGTEDCTDG